ncbi:hypothetical protein [Methanothrix harundinacea]|nr:hypothetical protein [Methanothrix harundinacea]
MKAKEVSRVLGSRVRGSGRKDKTPRTLRAAVATLLNLQGDLIPAI